MSISQGGFTSSFDSVAPPKDVLALTTNYKSSYAFADQYMPEVAEEIFKVRSQSSIRGMMEYLGQEEILQADKLIFAEEGAKHSLFTSVPISSISGDSLVLDFSSILSDTEYIPFGTNELVEVHDTSAGTPIKGVAIVTAVVDTDGSETLTVKRWDSSVWTGFTAADTCTVFRVGSSYKKGADGANRTETRTFDLYNNKPFIAKKNWVINGSDMTNKTWLTADGQYFWHLGDLDEADDVFQDDIEKQMLVGEKTGNSNITDSTYGTGSDGLFPTLVSRGGNFTGYIDSLTDVENLIKYLDQAYGEPMNMLYLNRTAEMSFSKTMAGLNAAVASGYDFGEFGNAGAKMLDLDFTGVKYAGYKFAVSSWNVLNNPEFYGSTGLVAGEVVNGLMVPYGVSNVADDMGGSNIRKVPYITIMPKAGAGENRKYKHWLTGSAGIATPTTHGDYLRADWLTERALRVIGAQKFVLFAGANS